MPNSFESTTDSNSSSDLATVSTVGSLPTHHFTSQPNPTYHNDKPAPLSGVASSNFAHSNPVYVPATAPTSRVRWQHPRPTSPGMPTQLSSLGPQPVATMSEKEREDYIKREASIRRTEWYNDQFAYKPDQKSTVVERIMNEAPVTAELRTNVIVSDNPLRSKNKKS